MLLILIEEMALWIKILQKLGSLHHSNPNISLHRELKHLVKSFLYGSLIEKDQHVADKILDHTWGSENSLLMKKDSNSSSGQDGKLEDITPKIFENLKLSQNEVQIRNVNSLLYNIREGFSTILCAPTMTGKSIMLKVRNLKMTLLIFKKSATIIPLIA